MEDSAWKIQDARKAPDPSLPSSILYSPSSMLYPPLSLLRCCLFGALVLPLLAGCGTVRPLPPADLKQPGWTVHTGQAVWHLPKGGREVAGEVLVATRGNGQSFVQFSKNPFPLVVAQSTPRDWEVEFPPQNKHYAGRGAPPKRLLWLWLPRVLSGQPPPRHWFWHQDAAGWELENPENGESLKGYFTNES